MLKHSARNSTTSSDHPRRCGGQTRCPACISAPPARTVRSAFGSCRQTEASCSLQRSRVISGRWSATAASSDEIRTPHSFSGSFRTLQQSRMAKCRPKTRRAPKTCPRTRHVSKTCPKTPSASGCRPKNTRHPYNCLSPDSVCRLNKKSLVGSRSEQLPTRDPQNPHRDDMRKGPLISHAVPRCRAATRTSARNELPR